LLNRRDRHLDALLKNRPLCHPRAVDRRSENGNRGPHDNKPNRQFPAGRESLNDDAGREGKRQGTNSREAETLKGRPPGALVIRQQNEKESDATGGTKPAERRGREKQRKYYGDDRVDECCRADSKLGHNPSEIPILAEQSRRTSVDGRNLRQPHAFGPLFTERNGVDEKICYRDTKED
jgi:hypothetical protein